MTNLFFSNPSLYYPSTFVLDIQQVVFLLASSYKLWIAKGLSLFILAIYPCNRCTSTIHRLLPKYSDLEHFSSYTYKFPATSKIPWLQTIPVLVFSMIISQHCYNNSPTLYVHGHNIVHVLYMIIFITLENSQRIPIRSMNNLCSCACKQVNRITIHCTKS